MNLDTQSSESKMLYVVTEQTPKVRFNALSINGAKKGNLSVEKILEQENPKTTR